MEPNVTLLVGEEEVEIKVWHQVMMVSSPIFRKMLQPNAFHEGKTLTESGSLKKILREDDPEAMQVMCSIFHNEAEKVPRILSSDLLAKIASHVDFYDCARAIQPWPEIWLGQNHIQKETMDLTWMPITDLAKWILISCHLGNDSFFSKCCAELIYRSSIDDFGREDLLVYFNQFNKSLQDVIKDTQSSVINSIRSVCIKFINDMELRGTFGTEKIVKEPKTSYEIVHLKFKAQWFGGAQLLMNRALGINWKTKPWSGSPGHYTRQLDQITPFLKDHLRSVDSFQYPFMQTEEKAVRDFLRQIKMPVPTLALKDYGNQYYRSLPS